MAQHIQRNADARRSRVRNDERIVAMEIVKNGQVSRTQHQETAKAEQVERREGSREHIQICKSQISELLVTRTYIINGC